MVLLKGTPLEGRDDRLERPGTDFRYQITHTELASPPVSASAGRDSLSEPASLCRTTCSTWCFRRPGYGLGLYGAEVYGEGHRG